MATTVCTIYNAALFTNLAIQVQKEALTAREVISVFIVLNERQALVDLRRVCTT